MKKTPGRFKVLHTSDWHLGQKFNQFDRREELQLALEWVLETIREQEVDALLIAGDVFDISSPPSYAEEQYYRFLAGLLKTPCRQVVITAGNHDSPAHLEAPRELLSALHVHVRVRAGEDELIVLRDSRGKPEAVVAAVPFLRDRDLGAGIAAESPEERMQRLRARIKEHYEDLARKAEKWQDADVPCIAMGHLYAFGAEASDPERQKNIYLGDEKNMAASDFPSIFRYVALGHIHRAQAVGGMEHVRYSGSLIPLSFRETIDQKSVTLSEWEGQELVHVREIQLPCFRRLKTIKAPTASGLLEKMRAFAKRHQTDALAPWVDLLLEDTAYAAPDLRLHLEEEAHALGLQLLQIRLKQSHRIWEQEEAEIALDALTPREVFQERCKQADLPKGETEKLRQTFDELLEWMQQKEESA